MSCGTTLFVDEMKNESISKNQKKEYTDWKKSVPYLVAVILFLTFIDLMSSGGSINWSYWATVPIFLFAIVAPYFSFKMMDS
ncbi:MAG: hypothetical protein INQ03_23580 [Candidatus Heimdallarchaeota archaeon]|nr:hypothetical protein [Candidatus Heimdallarchaeota archaeon]